MRIRPDVGDAQLNVLREPLELGTRTGFGRQFADSDPDPFQERDDLVRDDAAVWAQPADLLVDFAAQSTRVVSPHDIAIR